MTLRLSPLALALLAACPPGENATTDDGPDGSSTSTATGSPPTPTSAATETPAPTTTVGLDDGGPPDTGTSIGPDTTTSTGPDTTTSTGPDTTTSTGPDTTTSTGPDATTSTGPDDGSSGDSSTGEPGVPDDPKSCLAGDLPYAGPLCGGLGPACVIERDEVIDPIFSERVDLPAIALDQDCRPHVLYNSHELADIGHYARRDALGVWKREELAMPLDHGGLVIDPADGVPTALIKDGADDLGLFRREADVWQPLPGIAGPRQLRTDAVALDGQGRVWAATTDDAKHLRLEFFDGAWKSSLQGATALTGAITLALSPVDDRRHLITWRTVADGILGEWQVAGAPPEPLVTATKGPFSYGVATMAVAPGDAEVPDVPWVLLSRTRPDTRQELLLAHRPKPGAWIVEPVAEQLPGDKQGCGLVRPAGPGDTCKEHLRYIRPEPVLVSLGGDMRFLWSEWVIDNPLEAVCDPDCFWVHVGDEQITSGKLFIGWRTAAGPQSAVLADLPAGNFDAAIDSTGDIHLAFLDLSIPVQITSVRYLRVGLP